MVITTNDSCNTLVSLDVDVKNLESNASYGVPEEEYVRTELYVPSDDLYCMDADDSSEQQQIY